MKKRIWLVLFTVMALMLSACTMAMPETETMPDDAASEEMADDATMDDMGTIVDIAVGNSDFSTLVTAVTAADLVDVLADPEAEWTVFAPTNDAFAALPEDVLNMVLADKELLTRILTYHVMQGVVTSDQVSTMMAPTMEMGAVGGDLMGSELDVKFFEDGKITVNDANIVMADVMASNGVIHAIDAVLLPPDVAAMLAGDESMDGEAMDDDAMAGDESMDGEAMDDDAMDDGAMMDDMGTIVDIAVGNPDFSTLVTAVTAAGLVDVLANPDAEWTVFAPTNAAFDALPEGVLEMVLADNELLTRILTYHVVEGIVTSDQISTMMAPSMEMGAVGGDLLGGQLDVKLNADGTVTVNNSNVIAADIMASNGVIHVIDAVLLPEDVAAVVAEAYAAEAEAAAAAAPAAGGTIVDIAVGNPDFSTLVTAVTAADLVDVLADPEAQWTVFAPTNAAFDALPEGVLEMVLADKELLTRILTYHVMQGVVTSDQVSTMMAPSMEMGAVGGDLMGSELDVKFFEDGKITVNDANIILADVLASNGVIHAIDAVLLPPDVAASLAE